MTAKQYPRHATLPPEIEEAVRTAWRQDWQCEDDGYDRLVKQYPAWECTIAALWITLDDDLFAACAPEEMPTPLTDAIDDCITVALEVFRRVQRFAGMGVQS